jgi:hypothetical protein
MTTETSRCERCQRVVSWESHEHAHWEAIPHDDGSVGEVCPDCLTKEERVAIDADAFRMAALFAGCSRCDRILPDDVSINDSVNDSDWRLLRDDNRKRTEFVCPDCLTIEDRQWVVRDPKASGARLDSIPWDARRGGA